MTIMELIERARKYANKCHEGTNHLYDEKPYMLHLYMVYDYAKKFHYLIPKGKEEIIYSACFVHDVIEDCRETYNDVKKELGIEVAEIAYNLANEKGRNRKERGNEKYYSEMRSNPLSVFVKICDRLANISYSKNNKGKMFKVYQKEHKDFKNKLYMEEYKEMFDEIEILFKKN